MIQRDLEIIISDHFSNSNSALLLTGARQVGKTFAIRRYAESSYLDLVEVNFFEHPDAASVFDGANGVGEVLRRLSAWTDKQLTPGKSLIFFDEIQKYPDVLTWIKFLVEDGRYKYALSGSLLGVSLSQVRSVPVGSLTQIEVYPLTLSEFAKAVGVSNDVMQNIEECWQSKRPVDPVVHNAMMRVVNLYLLIGGMPAAVQTYIDTNDIKNVQAKQKEILDLYHWDIAQYDKNNKLYIDDIFSLIPSELNAKNKRFILKDMNEHRQFSRVADGFIWLREAGVALPVYNLEEPRLPLLLNKQRNLFKLFQNDVGLLACQYSDGIALQILTGKTDINHGAIYENLVAQQLASQGYCVYYFNSKRQGEVDFVIENNGAVLPIEVKSGKDYFRHRALNNIIDDAQYNINEAYVLCNDNISVQGKVTYAPIYMLMFFKKITQSDTIYKLDMTGLE